MTDQNLLCVDWDYFFPNPMENGDTDRRDLYLYDWGHSESAIFIDGPLWMIRATGFLSNGLPLPDATDDRHTFWDRFTIADNAPLYVSDSNLHAGLVVPDDETPWDGIWLYDAHADSGGYRGATLADWRASGVIRAEDWMLAHHDRGTPADHIHVRYPPWKTRALQMDPEPAIPLDRAIDDGATPPVTFTAIHICRSGAWVPPWLDGDFAAFVAAAPGDDPIVMDDDTTGYQRGFDIDAARAFAEQQAAMLAQAATLTRGD